MSLKSIQSTVKMASGYEIPVVGFGVSERDAEDIMADANLNRLLNRSTKRMSLSEFI